MALEITGSNILATAQVIVEGNIIKGIAMAVSIPYVLTESALLKPDFKRKNGMAEASMLWMILKDTFVRVTGVAMCKSLLFLFFSESLWVKESRSFEQNRAIMENTVDSISPASRPTTAIFDREVTLCEMKGFKNVNIINTMIILPNCSVSCVIPGINAFCLPKK